MHCVTFLRVYIIKKKKKRNKQSIRKLEPLLLGWGCNSAGRNWTGTPPTQVQFLGAARDFSLRVNYQCRLSYSVHTLPCDITCIYIYAHIKDPIVHVRVWWIIKTLKHPECTLAPVARLSQLAFPGEGNPHFPWEKSHWDNTVVKSNKK